MNSFSQIPRILIMLCILLLCAKAYAQTPDFVWAKNSNDNGSYLCTGSAVDSLGNTFITGFFQNTVQFGNIRLTSSGGDDVFLIKYDAAGNIVWARSGGGQFNDFGWAVAVDPQGNSYITGYFDTSPTFGNITIPMPFSPFGDMFIVKYDTNGNVIWAKSSEGTGNASGSNIAVDATGNSYVTGIFSDTLNLAGETFMSNGTADMFITKYDSAGTAIWAKHLGDVDTDVITSAGITTDLFGNFYVTGNYIGNLAFDHVALSSPKKHTYIAKYNSAGNVVWVNSTGGNALCMGHDIKTDEAGNVYVAGSFQGNSQFGPASILSSPIMSMFAAKFNSAGHLDWAKQAGGTGAAGAGNVAVDGSGNCYIIGEFTNNFTFGTNTITSTALTDIFIGKIDNSGNFQWIKSAGGTVNDRGSGIGVDATGNCYVSGNFQGQITFGNFTLVSSGSWDFFLAKLGTFTGTPEETTNSLTGYPNPFTTSFQIALPAASAQPATAILTDLLGREVHRQVVQPEAAEAKVTITPAAHLPSGVYVLQLRQGDTVQQVKVVKQ